MRDLLVKIFVKLGLYKPLVNSINRIKFQMQSQRMKKHGLEMLREADKALSAIDVKVFLSFGTLLGAYRDHGFISYDPDIDLGVVASQVPDNIHQQMEKAGFKLFRQNVMADTKQLVEETYVFKGLHLDIFYYYQDGPDYYTIIAQKHETKDWKEANATDGFPCRRSSVPFCDFERRDFLGLKIWMPVNTDGWLRDMYSDNYMTPIKNWEPSGNYVTRNVPISDRSYRVLY